MDRVTVLDAFACGEMVSIAINADAGAVDAASESKLNFAKKVASACAVCS